MSIYAANVFSRKHAGLPLGKRVTRGLLGILLAAGLLGVMPAASHASAYGYQYWAAEWTGGIKVLPAGQLFHAIEGKSDYIRKHGGNYLAVGNLCDTALKFTYGYGQQSWWSDTRWGCSRAQGWKYAVYRRVPTGTACAELWAQNRRHFIAKQCHRVSR